MLKIIMILLLLFSHAPQTEQQAYDNDLMVQDSYQWGLIVDC